ncbi:hypothetical protein HYT05_03290 [Candidatus Kaiserbacteria bacterium]|nr:hypothetical protein [Candidatus Kaiserbacteria bacterium]
MTSVDGRVLKRGTFIRFLLFIIVVLFSPLITFAGSQTYSTSGSYTFTVPLNFSSITVEVWGGGGGGQDCTVLYAGTSAAKAYCSGGIWGGDSSFGTMIARGGHGSGGITNSTGDHSGGTASGGDINLTGEQGNWNGTNCPGKGGASPNGGGRSGGWPGGGGDGSCMPWGADGGGGGGYAKKTYSSNALTPGAKINVTVGAGGASRSAGGAVKVTWNDAVSTTASTTTTSVATTTATSTTTSQTAAIITNVHTYNITTSGAEIRWDTDIPSNSRVAVGTTAGAITSVYTAACNGGGYVTSHCVTISGLQAGTAYYYKVESMTSSNADAHSELQQFSTIAAPIVSIPNTSTSTTTTLPLIAITGFTSGTNSNGTVFAGVGFNNPLAADTITDAQVYIINASTGHKLPGIASKNAFGISYTSLYPGIADVDYLLIVKAGVQDVNGSKILTDYVSRRFQADASKLPKAATVQTVAATTTKIQAATTTTASIEPIFSGRVTLGGKGTSASMWAWSDRGEKLTPAVAADGSFSVLLTKGTIWHVGAGKKADGVGYKSTEITIDTRLVITSQDLALEKIERPLPKDVSIRRSSSDQVTVQADNGAQVVVPPHAVQTGGTSVTVTMNPTVEAPNQASASVVGIAYDITAKDNLGNQVTSLASSAQITLPYDPRDLEDLGITANALVPSYYDEQTKAWVKILSYKLDTINHTVTITVDHFTRFALVAAADVTPPTAPSKITSLYTDALVRLDWTNPTKDFDHAKVYRSTVMGKIGTVKAAEVFSGHFADADIVPTTTYYYTVRAVDPAGNESSNIDQIKVSTGIAPGTPSKITLSLKLGARGSEVVLLQNALINEGFLEADLNTGYFGKMTFAAVVKFQEKYADEVLVGSFTRNKINALYY